MASILVLCTGNVCRSPIAEGVLREALRGELGERAPEVSSAGTAGWEGSAAMPESVRAAAEVGVDISAHTARRLVTSLVEQADLVIGMAGEHRVQVVHAVPDAAGITFSLKELVRLLEALPPSAEPTPDRTLAVRVAEADALRRSGFEGNPLDDDVVDPLGLPLDSYRAIAWELDGWCARLVAGLYGHAREPMTAGAEGE
jgi:protein-tyrosine phosphatase